MDADVAMNPNTKRQLSKAPIHEVSGARNSIYGVRSSRGMSVFVSCLDWLL